MKIYSLKCYFNRINYISLFQRKKLIMTTKKQDLIDNPKELSSDTHLLECFFSESLNKFCLRLNAKLFTFKTWNGYVNRRNKFVSKYNLK